MTHDTYSRLKRELTMAKLRGDEREILAKKASVDAFVIALIDAHARPDPQVSALREAAEHYAMQVGHAPYCPARPLTISGPAVVSASRPFAPCNCGHDALRAALATDTNGATP